MTALTNDDINNDIIGVENDDKGDKATDNRAEIIRSKMRNIKR
ncbi:16074_t:CDS:2, partial [Dentiscutata erythropus]